MGRWQIWDFACPDGTHYIRWPFSHIASTSGCDVAHNVTHSDEKYGKDVEIYAVHDIWAGGCKKAWNIL